MSNKEVAHPVVLKSFVNRDDIVGFVVPGHAAHQTDGQLVVLTVQLQLLLMLLAHIQSQARPVADGRGHAAHAGAGLALLRLLQLEFQVPSAHPRVGGRVRDAGFAHTLHDVAEERVGSQFALARLSALGATRDLVGFRLPALDDAHLAKVVAALEDHRVAEQLQTHRAGELRVQLLKRVRLRHSLWRTCSSTLTSGGNTGARNGSSPGEREWFEADSRISFYGRGRAATGTVRHGADRGAAPLQSVGVRCSLSSQTR